MLSSKSTTAFNLLFFLLLTRNPLAPFPLSRSPAVLLWHCSAVGFAGSAAAAVGLHPGQCVLKVNGNSATHANYVEVLEHFTAYRTRQEEALV